MSKKLQVKIFFKGHFLKWPLIFWLLPLLIIQGSIKNKLNIPAKI